MRFFGRLCIGLFAAAVVAASGFGQESLTWQEVRGKFETANPTLRAGQIGIGESKAQEITAVLRANPNNAQSQYRSVQVSYLNLVASYLSAANQLNLAVGREVLQ